MNKREQIEKILQEEAGLQTKYFKILIDRILALDDDIRTATLDEVQTGIDNKVSYETRNYLLKRDDVNSVIDNLRGNDDIFSKENNDG